jgi:hypothetical protein
MRLARSGLLLQAPDRQITFNRCQKAGVVGVLRLCGSVKHDPGTHHEQGKNRTEAYGDASFAVAWSAQPAPKWMRFT